jgi:hypothetical protein
LSRRRSPVQVRSGSRARTANGTASRAVLTLRHGQVRRGSESEGETEGSAPLQVTRCRDPVAEITVLNARLAKWQTQRFQTAPPQGVRVRVSGWARITRVATQAQHAQQAGRPTATANALKLRIMSEWILQPIGGDGTCLENSMSARACGFDPHRIRILPSPKVTVGFRRRAGATEGTLELQAREAMR